MWFRDQEIPEHGILSGTHRLLHPDITRSLIVTSLLDLLLKLLCITRGSFSICVYPGLGNTKGLLHLGHCTGRGRAADITNRSHRLRDLWNQRRLSSHDQVGVRQHLLGNLYRGTLSTAVTLALDRWGRAEYAADVVEQSISPNIR